MNMNKQYTDTLNKEYVLPGLSVNKWYDKTTICVV